MTPAERLSSAKQNYDLALAAHQQQKLEEAAQHYRVVHDLFPEHPGALHGLGLIALRTFAYGEAETYLRLASKAAPGNAAIHHDLGQALLRLGRYEDALRAFRTALRLQPDNIAAMSGAGDALNILGRPEEAQTAFRKILAHTPDSATAHFGMANAHTQLGDGSKARAALERAIVLAPQNAAYQRALAELEPFTEGDSRLRALQTLAREEQRLPDGQKVELHFALAKVHDDLKHYDAAFEHLKKGNTLRRGTIAYDERAVAASFAALKLAFSSEGSRAVAGDASTMPIFVVGMPRSGTTLVEQILSSDPSVAGAGELTYLQDIISEGLAGDYPRSTSALTADACARLGKEYVRRLGKRPSGIRHVIDKFPGNFCHIGLIRRALPNAKIIHLRRDPMDTCFSCYSKLFLNGLNYSYDLGELGRYYRMYDDVMAHWRSALPDGAMLEVQYETLVGDFEKQARRLVEFCDLTWSDRFLSFHENSRAVRTHSQGQVRLPLFASSIGRWRNYESHLQSLRDALGQTA